MSKTAESEQKQQHLTILLKGGVFALFGSVVSKFASYLSRLIVARIGPEYYGLLALALAIFSFASFLALFGFSDCILRHVSYFYKKKYFRKLKGAILFPLKFTFILSLLVGFCLFILSDWISLTFFHDIRLSILLKIFAFAIPFDVLRLNFMNIMAAFKKAKLVIFSKNLAESIPKLIMLAIFIWLGYGLFGATLAYTFAIFISFVVSFLYFKRLESYKLIISKIKPIYLKKDMLAYAIPLLFTSTIFFLISWTDTFMLGYFKSAYAVGIYNAAYPTAQLLWVIPSALLLLALPIFAESYASENRWSLLKYLMKKITKWVFILNIMFLLIFSFFSNNVLSILFGTQYTEGKYVLIILSIAFFIWSLFEAFDKLLLTLKKNNIILLNALVVASLNILLNYLLIPKWGIFGAAIATGSSLILLSFLRILEVYIFTKMFPFDTSLWKVVCSGFLALIFVKFITRYFLEPSNIVILVLIIGLFGIFYAFSLLLFHSVSKSEYNMFLKFQKRAGIDLNRINKIILRFVKK